MWLGVVNLFGVRYWIILASSLSSPTYIYQNGRTDALINFANNFLVFHHSY